MTAITERIPLDKVSQQARSMRPGRTLLALITAPLFGAAWLLARTVRVLWMSLAWAVSALKVGWEQGSGRHARPPVTDLIAENERLRAEVERLSGR